MSGTRFEALEERALLATIAWDGGGQFPFWNDPLNWAGDVLPGPTDTALLDVAAADITVQVISGVTVGAVAGTERLKIAGGGLHVLGDSEYDGALWVEAGTLQVATWLQRGDFRFEGGTVVADTLLSIEGGGVWEGGALYGAGTEVHGGDFRIIGGFSQPVQLRTTLYLFGEFTWHSGRTDGAGGAIRVMPGTTLNLRNGFTYEGGDSAGFFNGGTLVLRDATIDARFYSGGARSSVLVEAGAEAAIRTSGAFQCPITVEQEASVEFFGDTIYDMRMYAGTTWVGEGELRVTGFSVLVMAEGFHIKKVVLEGEGSGGLESTEPMRIDVIEAYGGFVRGPAVTVSGSVLLDGGGLLGGPFVLEEGGTILILHPRETGSGAQIVNHGHVLLYRSGFSNYIIENHGVIEKFGPDNFGLGGLSGNGDVFVRGGSLNASFISGTFGGTIIMSPNTGLGLGGTVNYLPSTRIEGDGTVLISSYFEGETVVRGTIHVRDLVFAGRVFLDTPDVTFQTFGVGAITFRHTYDIHVASLRDLRGRVEGPGRLFLEMPGEFHLPGTLEVAGEVISRAGLMMDHFASIRVAPGGRFVNEGLIRAMRGSVVADGVFTGPGIFRKIGNTTFDISGPGLALGGGTEVRGGTLRLAGGSHSGSVSVFAGTILQLGWEASSPGAVFTSTSRLTGAGTVRAWSGNHVVRGIVDLGALNVDGGSVLLWEGSAKSVGSMVLAAGLLGVGARADLSVTGDALFVGGATRMDIAGTSTDQFGSIVVGGRLTNSGSAAGMRVQFIGGYTPQVGQGLNLIRWTTRTGVFSSLQTPTLPPGVIAELIYPPTAVRLRFVAG